MIDLRSDTVTTPTDEMRAVAAEAPVGDDVYREDPSVAALETEAAAALGRDAALFVPSGTMANQIAVVVHTEPGSEAIVERESHVYKWELGGLARHAGVQARTVDGGPRGVVTPAAIDEAVVESSIVRPGTELVCVENTHNSRGGTAIAPDRIAAAVDAAHDHDLPVHLDGARIWNAAVAHDVAPATIAGRADTVTACLSKGLGAPVGSVLAGPEPTIERARRARKAFGGGMRQAGLIAEPARLAIEAIDRLADDHENAGRLADGLRAAGYEVPEPETNIVVAGTDRPAETVVDRWAEAGVRAGTFGEHAIRLCTHRDVSRADIDRAVDLVRDATPAG
ncbi:low specificity L-threonine aldolase [Halobacteriales archaeon SW_7_68_16]|nr:MAG: low specificity L-threonine aldolase [Halobacteriales archaeon SW_7_68_16]